MFILDNNVIIIKEHIVKITPYFEALNTGTIIEKDVSDPFMDVEPIYKNLYLVNYKSGCTLHFSDGSKENIYSLEVYESEDGGIKTLDMEKIKNDVDLYTKEISKLIFENKTLKKLGIRKK